MSRILALAPALAALSATGTRRTGAAIAATGSTATLAATLAAGEIPRELLACAIGAATGTLSARATAGAADAATKATAAFGAAILAASLGEATESLPLCIRKGAALAGALAATARKLTALPPALAIAALPAGKASGADRPAVGIGGGLQPGSRRRGCVAGAGAGGHIGLGRHVGRRDRDAAQGGGHHGAGIKRRTGIVGGGKLDGLAGSRRAAITGNLGQDRAGRQRGAQKQKAGKAFHVATPFESPPVKMARGLPASSGRRQYHGEAARVCPEFVTPAMNET